MELNDLKASWQNAGDAIKTEADLLKMTKVNNHPSLKKIRKKLIAETFFLLVFLTVYYDWFDGDQKPFYANVSLVVGLLLYVATDVIGYVSITQPSISSNIKVSLNNYLKTIKRLSVFSLLVSLIYTICFVLFFTSVIHFTKEKSFLLLGFAVVLFQMLFWSQRIWNKWIKALQQQVRDLESE